MQYDIGETVTVSATFVNDEVPPVLTNPTSTTLRITDPARTETTPDPTNPSPGVFTYSFAAALDGVYHFEFVGTTGSVVVRVGGFFEVRATPEGYFTLPELRALPNVDDETRYTDARCHAAREWIESIIERECGGVSFIGRRRRETFNGTDANLAGGRIRLGAPYVIRVNAVTVDGVALSSEDIDEIDVDGDTIERRTAGTFDAPRSWSSGRRNIVITYTAGYSEVPPADLREAALQAARYRLLTADGAAGLTSRATSIVNDAGTTNLSTAGEYMRGGALMRRPTGLPDVDVVITGWAHTVNETPRSTTLDYDPQRGSLFHHGRR